MYCLDSRARLLDNAQINFVGGGCSELSALSCEVTYNVECVFSISKLLLFFFFSAPNRCLESDNISVFLPYQILRNLNLYVGTVLQVYLSRRREATGGTVLRPLLNRHLKKELEHSKIRTS